MIKQGFPAILDENTEILILGSLPSDESIRKHQYYGNPGNDFWRLLGSAIGENLQDMAYEKRLETLKRNRIGLWDVFKAGSREGSEDSKIRDEEINHFSSVERNGSGAQTYLFQRQKSRRIRTSPEGNGV